MMYGRGYAVDGSGNAYVTGFTTLPRPFPVIVGPDLTYNGGSTDAFVAKIIAGGSALVYCGYIGGTAADYGYGIAVDGSGNAYVTGETESAETTFPVIGGPDLTYNGGIDAFVAKISSSEGRFCRDLGRPGGLLQKLDTGDWVKMASPADLDHCRRPDGDGVDDLIGIWPRREESG